MDIPIKDCPWCKSKDCEINGVIRLFVECQECFARGPSNTNWDRAVELWNVGIERI